MPKTLKLILKLHWIRGDEYGAKVVTEVTDSCYKPKTIRHGLPPGRQGVPEMAYLTAEFTHEGQICSDIVKKVTQEIEGIHSSGHPLGVTAFVLVNGEPAGEAHAQFPRR